MPPEYFQYAEERSGVVKTAGRLARKFRGFPRLYKLLLKLNAFRKWAKSLARPDQGLERFFRH